MKLKRLLVLFVLLVLSDSLWATVVSSYEPFARMNAAKTYYFVSVPESPNSDKGYTAVFNAKTKALKFKMDLFFKNRGVFLSDNGEQLIQVNNHIDRSVETCTITIYGNNKEAQTIWICQKKSKWVEDVYSVSRVSDIGQEDNQLMLYASDSIYSIDQSNFSITARKNDSPETGKQFERYSRSLLKSDSFFDISGLKIGKEPLVQQLSKDLKFKLVNDKEKAKRAVFFTLTFNADGTFDFMQIDAAVILDLSRGKWVPDENLKEKIIQKMKSYPYLKSTVPEGLPYWVFSGKMYLL